MILRIIQGIANKVYQYAVYAQNNPGKAGFQMICATWAIFILLVIAVVFG